MPSFQTYVHVHVHVYVYAGYISNKDTYSEKGLYKGHFETNACTCTCTVHVSNSEEDSLAPYKGKMASLDSWVY